jgi:hypothetical protein
MTDSLRIVHHFPGRLRARAATLRTTPAVARSVGERLDELDGVTHHRVAAFTGSLVVEYDAHRVQLPEVIRTILDAGGFDGVEVDARDHDLPRPPPGKRVRAVLGRLDRHVHTMTRGDADLRTAVPGTLAGLALVALVFGRRQLPAWYDLAFWSFVTFANLNPPALEPDVPAP